MHEQGVSALWASGTERDRLGPLASKERSAMSERLRSLLNFVGDVFNVTEFAEFRAR